MFKAHLTLKIPVFMDSLKLVLVFGAIQLFFLIKPKQICYLINLNKVESMMVTMHSIEKLMICVKFWFKKQNEKFHFMNNPTISIEVLRIPHIR